MDRGLIGSKEQPKAEEPFVALAAAEGADNQKEMEKGFARSLSSRSPHFFSAAVWANQNFGDVRSFVHTSHGPTHQGRSTSSKTSAI
jgi:hypothetical protein